ncbi:TauD/TfdA family dioxygenase [Roseofilum sp. BLCC_M154]|uniref:TauD/TfdA family dioxygenase n=1 Tax=Roseofilum acuticapitatum BLCC-M154 TaxID=3022444 RepID=A0ABT7AVN9_9CYAN|nr:TauD/TfdA family dioxygenase [Roseofilum acuticapitatum]MDJ1170985.1 TauD/TfdA family dioxygenase [Roseofilum acuticapitatum BLCC-M154]
MLSLESNGINAIGQNLHQNGWVFLSHVHPDIWQTVAKQIAKCQPMTQENGQTIYDVKANSSKQNRSDSQSQNPLRPHTDGSDLLVPPNYLALYCLKPDQFGGGYTTLADGQELLRHLTETDQQKMLSNPYPFFSKDGKQQILRPILSLNQNQPLFRFSYNTLVYGTPSPEMTQTTPSVRDSWLLDICHKIVNWFDNNHESIRIPQNGLLIFNNHRMLHSRTAYWDAERHLQRLWLI